MSKISRNAILTFLTCLWAFSFLGIYTYPSVVFPFAFFFICLTTAFLVMGIVDAMQKKHSLLRNYPLIGRLRWLFENERTKIQQYFIEHDTNGTPYNREKRSDIYQKAKGENNTVPFGTQLNVYENGYEFLKHSMYPLPIDRVEPLNCIIGSKHCSQKYKTSIYNISAMSYGALSDAAVTALNKGAKMGGFYHNTGEGGISPYHLSGGDLCFQFGTGYFGAGRTVGGSRIFDENEFRKNAALPQVKMIEIKLSQGAKPGHGGILPAKKNTEEIAKIRGVKPGTEVASPPYHSSFHDNNSLLDFIERVRALSGGKPVGIKMCVGDYDEVRELIELMKKRDSYPDFITIDGGEGGTGAAPLVFTNSIGTPLVDGLLFVNNLLEKNGLRSEIKIIASGKVSTSFELLKAIALGADVVNSARSFMISLGCIQARECNNNTCPVGVATQDRRLINGLDPAEKSVRVYNFHRKVIHESTEVLAAMGLKNEKLLTPEHIYIRTDINKTRSYSDLIKKG
jgi:glutamate synthase domain-containing protein 2